MERAAKLLLRKWKLANDCVSADQVAVAAWPVAVGKKVAAHTRATGFVRGRLIVEVGDNIWQSQLRSIRPYILARLEKDLGSAVVSEIEFRVVPPRLGPGREQRVVRGPLLQMETTPTLAFPGDDADLIADPFLAKVYKAKRKRSTA